MQEMGSRKVSTQQAPPALQLPTAGIVITGSRSLKELLVELLAEKDSPVQSADSLAMSSKPRILTRLAALLGVGCIWFKLTSSVLSVSHLHHGLQQTLHLPVLFAKP